MSDLVDKVAEAIRQAVRLWIKPYGPLMPDDYHKMAQAAIDALGFTGLTEFERLMLVDLLRITREQAEKVKSGGGGDD